MNVRYYRILTLYYELYMYSVYIVSGVHMYVYYIQNARYIDKQTRENYC